MKIRWLAKLLLPRLQQIAAAREPDFCVTRDGGANIYLRRWWLVPRNNWFNIYLHQMLLDDDDVLHDHPYVSVSLVLTNGLLERYKTHSETGDSHIMRVLYEGDIIFRGAHFAHQLLVAKPSWTLFVTGPRIREWGFWTKDGWIPWQKFVSVDQDSSKGSGSGTSMKK